MPWTPTVAKPWVRTLHILGFYWLLALDLMPALTGGPAFFFMSIGVMMFPSAITYRAMIIASIVCGKDTALSEITAISLVLP